MCVCVCHGRLARWRKWSVCDVGEVMLGGLEYELDVSEAMEGLAKEALLILQPLQYCFTYITGTSPMSHMVCVCVHVFQCRPNCTIMCLGFCTRWIDGVECGLFFIHAPLGQTKFCVRQMWDDGERKGEGETRCWLIACSSWKAPRGPPGLTSPSDGRITINNTICLLNLRTAEGFGI